MNIITYTPKHFFDIKKTYKSDNKKLDDMFNSLFNIKHKNVYFKTEFSIEE